MKRFTFAKTALTLLLVVCCLAVIVPAEALAAEISTTTMTSADDNCTAIYIGSAVSEDGSVIIARCADTHPTTTCVYLKITEASSEKGRTVSGKNGFVYRLPEETYRYISVPRPASFEKGNSWDSAASNEKGVAVTATVTGYVCDEALAADPYIAEGLTEDNIAGIVAACADSARSGIEIIAGIIDEYGSGEANIFMVADQKECWYMEIYTGHQYAAVKLPEDCVAGFGNEFMLDTLSGFDELIVSEGLETVPADNGFAQYDDDGALNLFNTYSGEGRLADYANLRTWRIHRLLAPSDAGEYSTETKYDFLYQPDGKVGVADVIDIFRDRYEGTEWEDAVNGGKVRVIATETASQVHVMQVFSELPEEIAVTEWMCFSNANYAPFVPISNGITAVSDAYGYIPQNYELDENSAHCIYKKLNALAAQDRDHYGLNIEKLWQEYESIWMAQYREVLENAAEYFANGEEEQGRELLTTYCVNAQEQAVTQAEKTFDDLLWYIMEDTDTLRYDFSYETLTYSEEPYERNAFMPLVNAAAYAEQYGWAVADEENGLSLNKGGEVIRLEPSDGKRTSNGLLIANDETIEIKAYNADAGVYIPLDIAVEYIRGESSAVIELSR